MARKSEAALHVASQLEQHGCKPVSIHNSDEVYPYADEYMVDFEFADDAVADGAEELLDNRANLSMFVDYYMRVSPHHVRVALQHVD